MSDFVQIDQLIELGEYKLDTSVIKPKTKPKSSALFLHGGGPTSSKELYLPMAKALAKHECISLVFSYPGHGKSPGQIMGSSLAERTQITKELATRLGFLPGTLLCGSSMGAHIAMRLVDSNFQRLALLVPAIYAAEAENVAFGPEFSQILRKEGSFRKSKALDSISSYKNQLVIFRAGQDKVIPAEVIDLIWNNARSVSSKQKVVLKESPHGISDWIYASPERLKSVAKALDNFNFKGLVGNT